MMMHRDDDRVGDEEVNEEDDELSGDSEHKSGFSVIVTRRMPKKIFAMTTMTVVLFSHNHDN